MVLMVGPCGRQPRRRRPRAPRVAAATSACRSDSDSARTEVPERSRSRPLGTARFGRLSRKRSASSARSPHLALQPARSVQLERHGPGSCSCSCHACCSRGWRHRAPNGEQNCLALSAAFQRGEWTRLIRSARLPELPPDEVSERKRHQACAKVRQGELSRARQVHPRSDCGGTRAWHGGYMACADQPRAATSAATLAHTGGSIGVRTRTPRPACSWMDQWPWRCARPSAGGAARSSSRMQQQWNCSHMPPPCWRAPMSRQRSGLH